VAAKLLRGAIRAPASFIPPRQSPSPDFVRRRILIRASTAAPRYFPPEVLAMPPETFSVEEVSPAERTMGKFHLDNLRLLDLLKQAGETSGEDAVRLEHLR